MLRRTFAPGVLWVGLVVAALALACGDSGPEQPPTDNGGQTPASQSDQPDLQPDPEATADDGYTLEVPIEHVGEHLVPTEFEASVASLLEASADGVVAALPARAKASVGKLFQPSVDSPTQESFWLHVFTDQSKQEAIDWVKHLGSQEPGLARFLSPHLEVFQAQFRPVPVVGDASVSIELLHGHSNGCWQTHLLVFAQDGLIVLLRNAIEVTREDDGSAQSSGRGVALCEEPGVVAPLTDIDAIARAISERLYSDR